LFAEQNFIFIFLKTVGFCGIFLYTYDILSNGRMFGESVSRDVEGSIHSMICLKFLRDITKNLMGIACL